MPGRHLSPGPVIAKDRPQPARGQRLPAVRTLRHHEQRRSLGVRTLGQQIGLDRSRDVGVDRHRPLLVSLADHPHPAASDIDIGDPQAQHLGRTQPRQQHQPANRPIPPRTEAVQQRRRLLPRQAPRQPPWFTNPQLRTGPRLPDMREQPRSFATGPHPRRPASRHRIAGIWVAHLPEREHRRDRRQPPVDRRRRVAGVAAVADRIHVSARTPRRCRFTTRGQKTQQHIDFHPRQLNILRVEPASEREQVKRIGTTRTWRVVPVGEVAEELIHQPVAVRPISRQRPPILLDPLDPQHTLTRHET